MVRLHANSRNISHFAVINDLARNYQPGLTLHVADIANIRAAICCAAYFTIPSKYYIYRCSSRGCLGSHARDK